MASRTGIGDTLEKADVLGARIARYTVDVWPRNLKASSARGCLLEEMGDYMIRAANSLAAYSDLRGYFDPLEVRERPPIDGANTPEAGTS